MGRKLTIAYVAPFVIFMLFTGLSGWLESARILPGGVEAKYLIYPLQTAVCAGILAYFWREYRIRLPRAAWLAAAVGAAAFVLWISPQILFHQRTRLDGFDPGVFAGRPGLYWFEVITRFLRLVVVVPMLEEIFWRGFLLRYLIKDEFEEVPFGTYSRNANLAVAIGFMIEHSLPDYPAALLTGFLYNQVAFNTRSLSSCIVAHALTNALLGAYIMTTHQWGFW